MGKNTKKLVIFITGCSSGFGYLTAKTLAKEGHIVYASMRNTGTRNSGKKKELEDFGKDNGYHLKVLDCDVLSTESVDKAIQDVIAAEKQVDVVVNNAGYGLYGPLEFGTDETIRHQFDTNVYGAIRVVRSALPHMRARRSGKIINVGSIAGSIVLPHFGYYAATKFALESLSAALLGECYLFDIKVATIQPHGYATNFQGSSMRKTVPVDDSGDYKASYKDALQVENDIVHPTNDNQQVADKIAWVIRKKNPPFRNPVGKNARRDLFFSKFMKAFSKIKMGAKMYGATNLMKKI
ncbi:MAG: SDR family oxidoreductase [Candidatus Hodarchaeota archaeon]